MIKAVWLVFEANHWGIKMLTAATGKLAFKLTPWSEMRWFSCQADCPSHLSTLRSGGLDQSRAPCSSNFYLMSIPLSSALLPQLPPFPPRPYLINIFWMPHSHPAPQTDAVVYWGESGLDTFAALGARVRAPR